ncbi:MAG: L-threonylcarbamoyladenylate synthase [Bacteroidota bacterium]|jgi:L-threonylcarbamoyladenylate synthase
MPTDLLNPIFIAKSELEKGNLVAVPTETVYGLAANGLNTSSVIKIFEAKNRPFFDPLILHTNSIEKIKKLIEFFPENAMLLAEKFWPGPMTLLLPKSEIVPDIVTSGLPNVAVRIPSHPLTLQLLESLEFPLAAPSANPFGYVSPTCAEHVRAQLGEKVNYILDGGVCEVGIESTIIGFENDEIVIYRVGGLAVEEVEKLVGKVKICLNVSSDPKAPGQLKTHYAPRKNLLVGNIENLLMYNNEKKCGIISFQKKYQNENNIVLSEQGDLKEAAQKLFSSMRKMDEYDIDIILAEKLPDEFLGRAINDRLERASVK